MPLVSWDLVVAIGVQYTARAIGPSVDVECNTTDFNCTLTHLQCGSQYNVSVTATQNRCTAQPITGYSFITAPCVPVLNDVALNCSSRSAVVMWSSSGLSPDVFSVSAVNIQGAQLDCGPLNGHSCVVDGLQCGQMYTFSVNATQGQCTSSANNTLQRQTAPCPPQNIQSRINCGNNTASVSWSRGNGTLSFTSTLDCSNGQTYICKTTETGCDITNLPCEQTCTVMLVAEGQSCNSSIGTGSYVTTAPCPPQNIQSRINCGNNTASVSWSRGNGTLSFTSTLGCSNGQTYICKTTETGCDITNLPCGHTCTARVVAEGQSCNSSIGPGSNVTTVPCKPNNLTLGVHCGNSSASLSWAASTGAVAYVGIAQSGNATTVYCQSTNTSCTLQGLVCGTVYNFTVQASDGICNSSFSEPLTDGAAPCPPGGLRAIPRTVVNDTQILRASWSAVDCPDSEYLLELRGRILDITQAVFDVASYWTSRTFFEIPLPCGSSYSATVRAQNSASSSVPSAAVSGTTVPCAPQNVTFSASLSMVTWNHSVFATNYSVYQVTSSSRTKLCMTPMLQCSLANISSGHIVATASNSAGESEGSTPVLVTAGRRR